LEWLFKYPNPLDVENAAGFSIIFDGSQYL
jgi:hypothetical protein